MLENEKPQLSQTKAVRVFIQPLACGIIIFNGKANGGVISFFAPNGHGLHHIRQSKMMRVGIAMPGPVRHGAKRNALVIKIGEGLQARKIRRKSEVAIANGQDVFRTDGLELKIMAGHERVAVNRRIGVVERQSIERHCQR